MNKETEIEKVFDILRRYPIEEIKSIGLSLWNKMRAEDMTEPHFTLLERFNKELYKQTGWRWDEYCNKMYDENNYTEFKIDINDI